jgi:serine/threonine protein kinase
VDRPGELLNGRYRLIELAGRGGMAEVWRAELVGVAGFRRAVAVKRVLPHLLDVAPLREMFIEEARVSAALDHPNIVQVFDFGEDSDGLYLAMQWVEGMCLRDLAELYARTGERVSPAIAAAIGIEILRGLEAAHNHVVRRPDGTSEVAPIIHRDVSPSNVLLSVRGFVKLADFGLARAFDRARMTPEGVVKGKVAYLTPEQLRGEPAHVRTDLYGVGAILWELLCGRRLFESLSDSEIVRALLRCTPHPSVRDIRSEVPEAIALAIDRALAVNPDERFASAAEFARDLGDALRGVPDRTDSTRLAAEITAAVASRARLESTPYDADEIPVEYSDGTSARTAGPLAEPSVIVADDVASPTPRAESARSSPSAAFADPCD